MNEAEQIIKKTQGQRKMILLASVCSLALLITALWFALSARSDLNEAIINVADIQRQHRQVMAFEEAHENWRAYDRDMQELKMLVEEQQLGPQNWRERGLTVENARMSRHQAQAYLSSLAHEDGYYFVPERFEMSVLQGGDDLLRWREGSTDELEMTLVGRYYIRRSQ